MSDNQLAIKPAPAFLAVAGLTGLDSQYLIDTVKKQCFKGDATDAQVDAFISIACEMKVNPLLPGMLYAYPISGGGIVPIMGPAGVYKKLVEHPEVDSWETEVFPADVSVPPTHAVTKIWRKGREKPLSYTALLSEWKINSNPNWNSRPRHMLSLRSLKHCASQIIHGIPYDEDDREIMGMRNVTGTDAETPQATVIDRPAPPKRAPKGVTAVVAETPVKEAKPIKNEQPGEIVDVTPPKVEDLQAAMKKREEKMVAATPVKEAPKAVEPAPEAKPVTARAFLRPDECATFACEVMKIEVCDWSEPTMRDGVKKKMPTVVAIVSGEYSGKVYAFDAAEPVSEGSTELRVKPEWVAGSKLKLTLWGKTLKSGQVQPRVESWSAAVDVE